MPDPTKADGSRIVTPACVNKGVALDGVVVYTFLTQFVAPNLEIPVRHRWSQF